MFQILNLLGFICIEVSAFSYHSRGSYFIFCSMTGFWFTGILLLFYLFHIIEKFYRIPWLKIEFGFCAVWTVLYLIASCLAATLGVEAFAVAAVSEMFDFHSNDHPHDRSFLLTVFWVLRNDRVRSGRLLQTQGGTKWSTRTG